MTQNADIGRPVVVSCKVPLEVRDRLDRVVAGHPRRYKDRSEALRAAVNGFIRQQSEQGANGRGRPGVDEEDLDRSIEDLLLSPRAVDRGR